MGPDVIAALPDRVAVIATFSVGYEHIDLAAAEARGILVTNTPGVLTEATADIALLLLLGAARRASEGERMMRAGTWTGWTPTQLMGTHLHGKRLGILGMGRIGQALARRARALGMEIHYHNRSELDPAEAGEARYHPRAEDLLTQSDALSLHFPATPQTIKFLNAKRLALLPKGAIVVNTARGAVVDDEALVAALQSGQVAAAGLDVYDGEPKAHPAYATLPNTFLLPHLGSATVETREAMGFKALDNLDAHFGGRIPPNRIQPAA
jgi:glyoxylate reductase